LETRDVRTGRHGAREAAALTVAVAHRVDQIDLAERRHGHASVRKRRSGPQQTLSWVYENVYLPRRTERKGAPPRRRSRLDLEAGIERFVALVGDKDIRDVSRRDAEQFVGSLNLPSVGTTKKAIGVLSTLFNSAVERELIGKNPFRGLGPDRYTVVAARRSYRRFDADQLSRIFCRTEMKSGSMLWVPRLLLLTGARLEEMAQLRAAWFTVRDRVHVIDLHSEREMIRERVLSGLERTRAKGTRLGRPPMDAGQVEAIRALLVAGTGIRETARRTGAGASTVQRIRASIAIEQEAEAAA
jgi:hypothetical protein